MPYRYDVSVYFYALYYRFIRGARFSEGSAEGDGALSFNIQSIDILTQMGKGYG